MSIDYIVLTNAIMWGNGDMEKIGRLLQKKLSEKKYFDICDFVEELYCMEYDLLILMARKFFNLFCIFHELNCEKYTRLDIPYQHERKIITNRALPLFREDIKKGKYKKVVVADDIIIHGRSIKEVYDEVVRLCPEVDVKLKSYMRDDQDMSVYENIIDNIESRYLVEPEDWKEMSDEIVRIFYVAGRPYLSYLPYFTLHTTWDELLKKIDLGKCYPIETEDMKYYGIKAFSYMGQEINMFQEMKSCKICTLRLYHYTMIDKVILIPYFCMEVIGNRSLEILSGTVRNGFLTSDYRELLKMNKTADEMRIMELEYTISTWMAMFFACSNSIPMEWHRDVELYNFGSNLLPDQFLECRQIRNNIRKLSENDTSLELIKSVITPEIKVLKECYDELKKKYRKLCKEWDAKQQWEKLCRDYIQRFVEELLSINGNIDEQLCKADKFEKKRLFGIPISYILDDLGEYFAQLYGKPDDKKICMNKVFSSLIAAVDSGKGTIVTRIVNKNQQKEFHESLIYAGEQNYKFYENTNFPVMYGLYLIEQELHNNNVKEKKDEFITLFSSFLEQKNIFFIKEEMQQIVDIDISRNFGRFLQNSYKKYRGNQVLQKAVDIAISIV